MGTRQARERQQGLWMATSDVVETPANVFYDRLNQVLDEHKFDAKVERLCRKFYKQSPYGRPSMAPGVYFRSLLIGYFEGWTRSVGSPGGPLIPYLYGNSWAMRWTKRRRTIPRFRGRVVCTGWRRTKQCSAGC